MDRLSELLAQFEISAGVFHSGQLCGMSAFEDPDCQVGHIHLLRTGRLQVISEGETDLELAGPALLFYPGPTGHRLLASRTDQPELVCATVHYGTGTSNPLANSLPEIMVLRDRELEPLRVSIEWLFREAFQARNGRQAMMNRLTELFLIQLLRHVMDGGLASGGMLAALAHPQLARVLQAVHQAPGEAWPLSRLASMAAMSRTKFAMTFRRVLGLPPGEYLIEWRVCVAQSLLRKGRATGWVAQQVGYENASGLAKAFRKRTGLSPREWLHAVDKPSPRSAR